MLEKILRVIIMPFVWTWVVSIILKSIFKHYKLLKHYHPEMDADTLADRVKENVINDLNNLKSRHGWA